MESRILAGELRATENSAAVSALLRILLDGLRSALRERTDVNEAQLEGFTHEALLRILERLDQFAGRSRFTTWAHIIAANTAFTELRRKRWQDVSLDALAADGQQLSEPAALVASNQSNEPLCKRLRWAFNYPQLEGSSCRDFLRIVWGGAGQGRHYRRALDLV